MSPSLADRAHVILDAIVEMHAERGADQPDIWQDEVAQRLGVPRDPEFTEAVDWLAREGLIEPVEEGPREVPGPFVFRLAREGREGPGARAS